MKKPVNMVFIISIRLLLIFATCCSIHAALAKEKKFTIDSIPKTQGIYVVDGKLSSKTQVDKLDSSSIETINILTGKAAVKKYGRKAKAGVVEIGLKKETALEVAQLDQMPTFPGGAEAWGSYLQRNMIYPVTARRNKITGKVIVDFVVEKTGEITEVKVRQGIGWGCDQEAARVIKQSPKWLPGIFKGKPERVRYTMPIAFILSPF